MTQTTGLVYTSPTDVPARLHTPLAQRLTAFADDELVLGHRNSEWTGHAPILEEDIAIANVAQDEIGHAVLWYGVVNALTGDDPDKLAYFRTAEQFYSAPLTDRPKGDWAFTMLRQFMFDAYEAELLPRLARSTYTPIADVAAKIQREELFHLRHSQAWVVRLAQGTDESRSRLVNALEVLWPLVPGLLEPLPGDSLLVEQDIVADAVELLEAVIRRITKVLAECGVAVPYDAATVGAGSRTNRTDGTLAELLTEMQGVARADPDAESW